MPTLLDLGGLPSTKGMQGSSLVPVMRGKAGRELIYMQALTNRMIRTKTAKYWIDEQGQEVLFDYQTDPHELRNVAQEDSHAALLSQMRVLLLRKVISARDPLPERIGPY